MSDNYFESLSENSTYSFNSSRTSNDSFENQLKNFPVDEMTKIFKDKKPEEDLDEIPTKANEGENNGIDTEPIPKEYKKDIFKVSKSDEINDTTLLKHKKRGRKSNSEEEKEKSHDKFSPDNIQRKIQVHYQTFILDFVNDILEKLGIRKEFKNISYEYKKMVNKSQFNLLKNSTIGDIISQQISDKYKKLDKDYNSNLHKYLKTYKFLEKIFNINYLTFFRMFYMKNEKIVDLKIFGIEKVISLSDKTETYYDNLENLKKEEDEKYIKEFEKCLKNNYFMEKFALYRDFSI